MRGGGFRALKGSSMTRSAAGRHEEGHVPLGNQVQRGSNSAGNTHDNVPYHMY